MANRSRWGRAGRLEAGALALVLSASVPGCGRHPATPAAPVAPAYEPELREFFAAKELQARALALTEGTKQAAEVWPYFAAASRGDWPAVAKLYKEMAGRSYAFVAEEEKVDPQLRTMVWQTLNESYRAYEKLAGGSSRHMRLYAGEIIKSIPPGSVYLAESDPGRFMVTFLAHVHPGNDFFIFSQNQFNDPLYLRYLGLTYGKHRAVPTWSDQQDASAEYRRDAAQRLREGKVKPGEQLKMEAGQLQIAGSAPGYEVAGWMTRILLAGNRDRRFFFNYGGYCCDWMYPRLTPHGLLLEVHHDPVAQVSEEVARKDREYWRGLITPMIGNWLFPDTSVKDICDYVERVHWKKERQDIQGDLEFIQSAPPATDFHDSHCLASWAFGYARVAIARTYAWRASQAKSPEEAARLIREADFASRQAYALCPYSYETASCLAQVLLAQNRKSDALLVARTLVKLLPDNPPARDLVRWAESFGERPGK
jgi:hypothetical protein